MEKPPFEKPKVRLFGDTEQAQGYLGAAYNLLFKVRALAQAAGVPVFGKVLQLPDGAVVQASTLMGIDTVSVYPPDEPVEPDEELREIPPPPPPEPLFLGLPASHAAQFGWFPPSAPGSLYGGARSSEGSPAEAAIWSNFRGKLFTTYLAGNMHWRAKDEKKAETVSWNWLGNTSKYDFQNVWLRVAGDPVTAAYTTAVPIAGDRSANYAAEEVTNSQHAPDLFILGKRVRAPFSILGACERKGKLIVVVPGTINKFSTGTTSQSVYRLDFLVANSPRAAIAGGVHNNTNRVPVTWTLLHSQVRLESISFFGGVFFSGDGTKAVARSGNTTKYYEFAITEDEQGELKVTAALVANPYYSATSFSSSNIVTSTSIAATPRSTITGALTAGTTVVSEGTVTKFLMGRCYWDIQYFDGTAVTSTTSGMQDFAEEGAAQAFRDSLPTPIGVIGVPPYSPGLPAGYYGTKSAFNYTYSLTTNIYNMKGEVVSRAQGRQSIAIDIDADGNVVHLYREGDPSKTITALHEKRHEDQRYICNPISPAPTVDVSANMPEWARVGVRPDTEYNYRLYTYTRTKTGSHKFVTRTPGYEVGVSEVIIGGELRSQRTYRGVSAGTTMTGNLYTSQTFSTQTEPSGSAHARADALAHYDLARGVFVIAKGERSFSSGTFVFSALWTADGNANADWIVTASNKTTMQVSVAGVLTGPTITETGTTTHTDQVGNPNFLTSVIEPQGSEFSASTNANRAYGLAALTPKRYIVSAPCYSLQSPKPHPTNYLAYASVDGKTKQITDIVKPPDTANFRFNPVKVR